MLCRSDRLGHAVVAAALVAAATLRPANAAETIHVGKAVPTAFTFTPLDIGVRQGVFQKFGLDVQIVNFTGRQLRCRSALKIIKQSWVDMKPCRQSPAMIKS